MKEMGKEKYDKKMDKVSDTYAIEEFLELELVSDVEE